MSSASSWPGVSWGAPCVPHTRACQQGRRAPRRQSGRGGTVWEAGAPELEGAPVHARVWGQGPAWCRTQGWPGAQSPAGPRLHTPCCPVAGPPQVPTPSSAAGLVCAGTFGQGCSGGRECLPVPGAEPSAARGLGAHGPSLRLGLEGQEGQEGCVSTRRLCLGSCLEQVSWSRGGVWPRGDRRRCSQGGPGALHPPPAHPGPGLHLGCPVPTPWLLEVRQLAGLPLQKPALRLTLQREQGSAEQRALGTLLEARGVRGQGPRSWFPTSSGCRVPSGEVLLMGTLGRAPPPPGLVQGPGEALLKPRSESTLSLCGISRGSCPR